MGSEHRTQKRKWENADKISHRSPLSFSLDFLMRLIWPFICSVVIFIIFDCPRG